MLRRHHSMRGRCKLRALVRDHQELIALDKMGRMFWREGVVDSLMRSLALISYHILISKFILPILPTPGSALRSRSCVGEMVGSLACRY
jgi:hypothetical protein